ncbi:MAG: molybdenum cofactor guanylyltransferase [Candidatus Marinimicrobia bacterium]|nr:molybdenum cofactor guanylyltransferase [Candidatus Neomarinimicrobiota bacterium]MCF7840446.1 molybdenum cofactor guanylyltransferase [Candidatus Neomarinimicrobiota bacterium]MCF7902948.1 molybdenum cofactor guanylyltransferase [Candidatus Neomarinimicrobiota bacterium]
MCKADPARGKNEICAAILAGGTNTRMGQNKAMLQVNGIPLIQHIHSQLTALFDTVVISANDEKKFAFLSCDVIPDETPDQGPLMAIYSVLRALGKPVFIVATDIPEIPHSILDSILNLAREYPESQVVVPVTAKGDYEPLFALYRPELIPVIQPALSAGLRHIYGLFSRVPITRYTLKPREILLNLNHPQDYQRYIKSGI